MINLGLSRIKRLLNLLSNPQRSLKVFHLAGTNGKGSVSTYLQSILHKNGNTTGKFTSPHLMSPNDSIQINKIPLNKSYYDDLTSKIQNISAQKQINATEFEIQTAVSFQAFADHRVDYAVIEVGLGGLEDATNILQPDSVLCTAITKIGIDHENFLGSDPGSIAKHKAGIIKPGVPCIFDATNDGQISKTIEAVCRQEHAPFIPVMANQSDSDGTPFFVQQNRALAIACARHVLPDISESVILEGIRDARWPGRLQWLRPRLLLDGAHNIMAATELRNYVDKLSTPIHWIVAFSKPALPILEVLVRPHDRVTATEFSAVVGMPWIKAQAAHSICEVATNLSVNATSVPRFSPNLVKDSELTVICGSLYLVADVLRSIGVEDTSNEDIHKDRI